MRTFPNRSICQSFFFFLSVCFWGLSACSRSSPTSSFPEGDTLPVSQSKTGSHQILSVRLLERIEKSPGTTSQGPIHFGSAIALFGDTIAVGAPENTALQGYRNGMVFIYQRDRDAWTEITKLVASDREDGFQEDLHFGSALALDADTLAVGAPGVRDRDTGNSIGAVYIFQRTAGNWEETSILYPSDKTTNAGFGIRVELQEDILLVSDGHAVYVFERAGDGWIEQVRLTGENMGEKDQFGFSMAVEGDHLAIGTLLYDPEISRYTSSAVYLYKRKGDDWDLVTKLTPGEGDWSGFGSDLDIEGETLIVGACGDETAGYMTGAVYIYENGTTGWKLQNKLVAGDEPFSLFMSGFGTSVDLEGDLLAVGAGGDSSQGYLSGSVYLFRRQGETWVDLQKLWPDEVDFIGNLFGADLKLSGNTLLVAAPNEFGNAVYIYNISIDR